MFRRIALVGVALVLVSCSDCGTKCTQGITFAVADVAGALARGTEQPLKICFDGQCRDVTIKRANAGGSVFLPFGGVGTTGDHHLTVSGSASMKGDYNGPLASYSQKTGCGTCALATVKIGADGAITPGVPIGPAPSTTTTAG